MQPYLSDAFRGTVERRVLGPGETSLTLELKAVNDALAAADMSPRQIDAMIVSSFIPDTVYPGNAAYLARELGLQTPAWGVESGCAGTIVALQTATALVRAGEFRNVMVAVSFTYSRLVDPTDSLAWFMADGAGAFLVSEVPEGQGVLGTKTISTHETCGAFVLEPTLNAEGKPYLRLRSGDDLPGRLMRERASEQLRTCVAGALDAAGVKLNDINFFVFNTPVAWFSRFGARVLEIDPVKTISTYPSYGNMGAALTTANLYHAAYERRIRPDDLVLLYAVGSMSTAGATVVRWGDVALGPPPPPSDSLRRE
jgi:3-oxoacyl-[acyl-carrier-protein] synthase-3